MSDGTPIIIKKKKGHEGHAHHGGSWKVAYADFVTAMMAFFMVMWIMGLSDETRAQIQGYFNDPLGFKTNAPRSLNVVSPKSTPGAKAAKDHGQGHGQGSGGQSTAQKDQNQLQSIKKKIEDEIAGDKSLRGVLKDVEMSITSEGLRIELVESKDAAFFETGSAVLNKTALELIGRIAPVLRLRNRKIEVEGHTDSVPYPSPNYTNWDLSTDRANSLQRALFKAGVNQEQLTGVCGYADTRLKIPTDPTDPRNRRVTILLPFKDLKPEAVKLPTDDLPSAPPGPGGGAEGAAIQPPAINP